MSRATSPGGFAPSDPSRPAGWLPPRGASRGQARRRSSPVLRASLLRGLLAVALALLAGCGRVPKIIVLEDPLSAEEHVALGVAYERKGELDLAQRAYERALKKEKAHFQARVNLGNVRLARKEYGAAREEYLRALEIRPGDPEATNNLAWTAAVSGERLDEAGRRLEAVLRDPARRTPALLDTLGAVRLRRGDRDGAEAALSEALAACESPGACDDATRREIRSRLEDVRKSRAPGNAPPPR